MRALFDIGPMVRKYSAVPFEQIRLIRDIAQFQLTQVRRGIAIIFAAGNGQAVLALERLTRFLVARDLAIELIVIDIESTTTQEMKQCFGRQFHGQGETQWIRDGKVIAFLEAYTADAEVLLLNYSRRLLDESAP
jgi:hypothetical protein